MIDLLNQEKEIIKLQQQFKSFVACKLIRIPAENTIAIPHSKLSQPFL
jgi:hypothetical protein